MTAKAPGVGDFCCQGGVAVFRVVVDMTGRAASTSVAHHIMPVFSLRLAQVATGAQLAQHGIGYTVPQRLKVHATFLAGIAVDEFPGHVDDASS